MQLRQICTHSPASAWLMFQFRPFSFTFPELSTFRTWAPEGYSQRGGCGSYRLGLGLHTVAGVFIPRAS